MRPGTGELLLESSLLSFLSSTGLVCANWGGGGDHSQFTNIESNGTGEEKNIETPGIDFYW